MRAARAQLLYRFDAQFLDAIYAIGSGTGASGTYSTDFIDITLGSSVLTGRRGQIIAQNAAGPGYDFVTGLGSPNVAQPRSRPWPTHRSRPTVRNRRTLAKAAVAAPAAKAVVTPHDIIFTPVTIVITVPGSQPSAPTPGHPHPRHGLLGDDPDTDLELLLDEHGGRRHPAVRGAAESDRVGGGAERAEPVGSGHHDKHRGRCTWPAAAPRPASRPRLAGGDDLEPCAASAAAVRALR